MRNMFYSIDSLPAWRGIFLWLKLLAPLLGLAWGIWFGFRKKQDKREKELH